MRFLRRPFRRAVPWSWLALASVGGESARAVTSGVPPGGNYPPRYTPPMYRPMGPPGTVWPGAGLPSGCGSVANPLAQPGSSVAPSDRQDSYVASRPTVRPPSLLAASPMDLSIPPPARNEDEAAEYYANVLRNSGPEGIQRAQQESLNRVDRLGRLGRDQWAKAKDLVSPDGKHYFPYMVTWAADPLPKPTGEFSSDADQGARKVFGYLGQIFTIFGEGFPGLGPGGKVATGANVLSNYTVVSRGLEYYKEAMNRNADLPEHERKRVAYLSGMRGGVETLIRTGLAPFFMQYSMKGSRWMLDQLPRVAEAAAKLDPSKSHVALQYPLRGAKWALQRLPKELSREKTNMWVVMVGVAGAPVYDYLGTKVWGKLKKTLGQWAKDNRVLNTDQTEAEKAHDKKVEKEKVEKAVQKEAERAAEAQKVVESAPAKTLSKPTPAPTPTPMHAAGSIDAGSPLANPRPTGTGFVPNLRGPQTVPSHLQNQTYLPPLSRENPNPWTVDSTRGAPASTPPGGGTPLPVPPNPFQPAVLPNSPSSSPR
jgi:hypothetical protein